MTSGSRSEKTRAPLTDLPPCAVSDAVVVAGIGAGYRDQGVYGPDGRIIPQSLVRQGSRTLNGQAGAARLSSVSRRLEGAYLYGGHVGKHYGHLMLETFSRLHLFLDDDRPIIFSELNRTQSKLFWKIMEAWGLDKSRVVLLTEPTHIEHIEVRPPGFVIRSEVSRSFTDAYERLGDRFRDRGGIVENSSDQPVYLSRSRTDPTGRYVFGENLIERILERNGFRIVHMQDLSMAEQINLVLRHKRFCGFSGSAFHNLLFARAPKDITFLTTGPLNLNFRLIEGQKSNRWTHVHLQKNAENAELGPSLLSIETIFEACEACGVPGERIWDGLATYRSQSAAYSDALRGAEDRRERRRRRESGGNSS